MPKTKFKTAKSDVIFKELLLNTNNQDILTKILETIFETKIKILSNNDTELNSGSIKARRKRLDSVIVTNIGIINIESNANANRKSYLKYRNTAFICNLYALYTSVGKKYNNNLICQVNLSYDLPKKYKPITEYKLQSNDRELFVDNLKIITMNMDFYKQIWYSKEEKAIKENKYIIMLTLNRKELEKFSKYVKDKVVNKYMSELDAINLAGVNKIITEEEDREFILNTEREIARNKGLKKGIREGKKQGIREGIKEGKKAGKLEGIIATAKNLLNMNMPIKDISKATGLSIDVIKTIKQ